MLFVDFLLNVIYNINMTITPYKTHIIHGGIDDYVDPDGDWSACPNCKLIPKVWIFDNGKSTACGCWNSMYDHFSIHAESIMSCHVNDGHTRLYHSDDLRLNWNKWCKTGKIAFHHAKYRHDGRW